MRKPWFPLIMGSHAKSEQQRPLPLQGGPPLKMIIFRGGDRSGPTNLWELVALTTTAIVNTRRDPRGRRSVCCLHAAVVIVAVVCGCHARLLRLWLLLLLLLLLLSLCEKEREIDFRLTSVRSVVTGRSAIRGDGTPIFAVASGSHGPRGHECI